VAWSVDMPEYASIDSNGLLTAKANGTVVVTATALDLSATVGTETITITGNAIPSDQTVTITFKPEITKSIMGHTVFDRGKYINVCHGGSNFETDINNATISNRYINDLEMNFGRSLAMVLYATRYTNNLIEDVTRPGFANLSYLRTNSKPTNGTTPSAAFSQRFPNTCGTLLHDTHNTYPDFMPKEVYPGSNDSIPVNKVAAGEVVANLLKYNYTDWSRPLSFEPINEPHFTYLSKNYNMLPKLADLHTQIQAKVKEIGAPVMVGGPCASTAWYYNNNYKDFRYFSDFVDATFGKLDFYSFHVYDFHRWDISNHTLGGRITAGLPLEGIMDLVSAYGWSKYNKELIYLSTEHGGTMTPTDQKAAMRSWFLGSATGFAADMKAKSQTDFLMVNSCIANTFVFMNRPHQVFKVVPFILIESFAWDARYHASILVANNYKDKTNWYESAQVMFYKYFKDVRGRRILSLCDNPDIQQQSFVENNKVIVLLNNLSNSKITMNLNYPTVNLESTMLRRLGRNSDFTPYFTETSVADARGLQLAGKESVAIFLNYRDAITESTKVDEKLYFATEMNKEFSTESTFNVSLPTIANAEYAYLRIGVGRGVGTDRNLSVWFNGVEQVVPMEKAANNLEDTSGYGSTKLVRIDKSLLNTANTVKVVFPDNKLGGVGAVTLCVGSRVNSFGLSNVDYDEPAVFHPIFPNPVNNMVHFSFTLINPAKTSLNVYDLQGKKTATIVLGDFSSGKYEYNFSTENLPSGTYICRLVAGVNEYSQKMIVK
jgi:hypothetical protein